MIHRNPSGSFLSSMLRAVYRAPHDHWLARVAGALSALAPAVVFANPTGGQVVAGSATIGTAGSNGVVVNQSSQRAAINWQQFSIGSNEYVQFVQPNSSSVVLNRVIGSNPSSIFGEIKANGQVFLINPNGILFAPGSTLDVSSLTASTLDISDADFMAGRYVFSKDTGAPDASVVNQGNVQVSAGGYVVLAGDYVENDGVINAVSGRVLLAAGGGATLTLDNNGGLIGYKVDAPTLARLAGVDNTGSIVANGGAVVMTADVANALTATAVNNSGFITAHSVSQQGGEILLLAQGGGIENSGTLDASASVAGVNGGTVRVKGDGRTRLTETSVIDTEGDGATGGFIEVSGHELNLRGRIKAGKGGTLLLDPMFLHIVDGSSNLSTASTNNVGVGWIQSQLNNGSNVTLQASDSIINVGQVARTISATVHTANLTMQVNDGLIDIRGLTISIKGNLDIQAAAGSGGQITMDGATAKAITMHAGSITVNGGLTATGGAINITGGGSAGSASLDITGAVTATGAFLASFSNEGGVKTGTITTHNVTAGSIAIVGEKVSTGNLTATAGHVSVTAIGPSDNNGSLHVAGNVKASHGSVLLVDKGGKGVNVTGSIDAAGNAVVSASSFGGYHTSLKTGNITAGGSVTIRYTGGGASVGTTVKVGNVDSQRQMTFSISDASNLDSLLVKTGTLTNHKGSGSNGQGIRIALSGRSPVFSAAGITDLAKSGHSCECGAGNINVTLDTTNGSAAQLKVIGGGAIKTTHGSVNLVAPDGSIDVGNVSGHNIIMNGRGITFGNLTAASNVSIDAGTTAHSGGSITALSGTTISARFIDIDLNASYGGNIDLANLAASSVHGSAGITIQTQAANGATHIVVNGNISVSGVGANHVSNSNSYNHGISSGMPLGGAPMAAFLAIDASGSAGAAHTIKVNGAINVTGHAGQFSGGGYVGSCECGTVQFHGSGGVASVSIHAEGHSGNVQLLGTTTVKGTDAKVRVSANAIKTGALNVTGSGHTFHVHANDTSGHSFTSHNNVGRADVTLQGSASGSAAATIVTGNVTVSGKGSASIALEALSITAGNISVTASKAAGSRHSNDNQDFGQHYGLDPALPGIFGFRIGDGSFSAGNARIFLGANQGSGEGDGEPNPAQTIKVGNLTVNGVGQANIEVVGGIIQTGSLNATAAVGKMKGNLSSSGEAGHFHTAFDINGGQADIELDTGSGAATAITINGGVTATGPVASVNLFGHTIKVSKGITITGKGGQISTSSSGTGGSGFTEKFTGPGPITSVSIGGVGSHSAGSINVSGTVSVKGPGIVGIAITGAKIALGGLSASASAAETYKVVDSQNGEDLTFTADSAAILVFQTSNGKPGGGPATINGNVTIAAAHGNVAMLSQLDVTGQVKITAGGDVGTDPTTVISRIKAIDDVTGRDSGSSGQGTPSVAGLQFKLKAAGISMVAGGNIDLTDATITTPGVMALKAGADIILSGVTLNTGTLAADAGSTIHNGGAVGTITTKALALVAGKNINLSSTQISVGSGVVAPVASNAALTAMFADPTFATAVTADPILFAGLAAAGLSPAAPGPDAVFEAGNTVTLGTLKLTGSYLYLQAGAISLLGSVTVPKGTIVQFTPNGLVGTIDVEGTGAAGATLNINDNGLFNVFPDGITLVLGGAGQSGDITLGGRGPFDIGSDNLIVDTTGSVTSLGNVISTGQVVSLDSLVNGVPPVTAGEIDPTSSSTSPNTDKNKQGQDQGLDDTGTGTGGTISPDTNPSSVCH